MIVKTTNNLKRMKLLIKIYYYFLFAVLIFFAGKVNGQADFSRADSIISIIQRTSFKPDTLSILAYGAHGDGVSDDRPAIQSAIDACSKKGGGVVLIPEGTFFLKGPISLRSNVNLHLCKEAILLFSPEPGDYLPAVFTRWEGVEIYNYSPMIYTANQQNIAITGSGLIDGNGMEKWVPFRKLQGKARDRVHNSGDRQVPVSERVFGEGDYLRNSLIQFINCNRILIDGFRLVNSPFWMIHPVYCSDIVIRDVDFYSLVVNNDGIDFDSSEIGFVENCTFTTGDDAIVFKSGRDSDGWRVNRPSKDIVVRNCSAPEVLHGIAFGSEMSGGIENIYVENLKLGKVASQAIQFKANKDRGSYIKDVFIRNVDVDTVGSHLIYFTNSYHSYRGGNALSEFHEIYLENIRCKAANYCVQLQGLEDMPLHDIFIRNVSVDKAEHVFGIKEFFKNIVLKEFFVAGKRIEL